jgi:hypothetical protein
LHHCCGVDGTGGAGKEEGSTEMPHGGHEQRHFLPVEPGE